MTENPRKLEKKKILLAVLAGVLIVFLIPIKSVSEDGNTKIYMSMFYKVICREEINPEYEAQMREQGYSDKERTVKSSDLYVFPFHFFAE